WPCTTSPIQRYGYKCMKRKNRKHSKIDKLPEDIKSTVEEMMQADFTYAEIANYIRDCGFEISTSSVQRHAATLNATVESLRMAQENFRVIMDENCPVPEAGHHRGHHPAPVPQRH
ncbi:phage protein Gp27 family protein, partial [Eubacterium aggregans]|uniref:phage protein Gp27 family protein n=1 Tax=Eubacterium aggregans TaxID=81409 RepID=UPI003F2DFD1B